MIIPDPGPPQLATGTYEPAVQEALTQLLKPRMIVYDVGANVGFFTLLADRLVSPGGTVVAFEPQRANLVALRRNLLLNDTGDIHVVEAAASDDAGAGAGKLNLESSMTGRLDGGGTVPVDVIRIDDFATSHPGLDPNLVKVDVEGHELYVLDGMRETLRRARPVVIVEWHQTKDELEKAFERLGYRVTALEEPGLGRHLLARPAG